ncbi:transcriptional regulator [Lysinibacillus sp. FJAT-14745]|uniref:helix-turn-helix transcriptional regulator n=1 Tax=Lysinibacillus sp. FJAT-14745 TaxID=1704289 RepID=UPI0006ABDA80|nr:AraC family transcriptional regulator [Lysinibacillus sp. FJAT-14745]KOP80202.1 transcriptional regulator [Lysinibacillus sp. FJAT-14745]
MKNDWLIQKTINWVESHLHEQISADDIDAVSGLSRYHFHRVFQTSVGMSVTEYIRMRRLANAASILLHTNERIIDIAFYYQFESQESFTRAFKKLYGLPPGQYRKVMRAMRKNKEESIMEEKIKGWFISGSHPYNYEIGIDQKNVHQGKASGYLKSKTVQAPDEFATMMQQFKANEFRNKRVKLSGFVKTENVKQFSGLWMRVDSASEDSLQFDNMSDRPIIGTNSWNRYSIVLDVPENSAIIAFGILLAGTGEVWLDGLSFEVVDKDTPTTHISFDNHLLEEPTNLSFEE